MSVFLRRGPPGMSLKNMRIAPKAAALDRMHHEALIARAAELLRDR